MTGANLVAHLLKAYAEAWKPSTDNSSSVYERAAVPIVHFSAAVVILLVSSVTKK